MHLLKKKCSNLEEWRAESSPCLAIHELTYQPACVQIPFAPISPYFPEPQNMPVGHHVMWSGDTTYILAERIRTHHPQYRYLRIISHCQLIPARTLPSPKTPSLIACLPESRQQIL